MELPKKPKFEPLKPQELSSVAEVQFQHVVIPPHRYTKLREALKHFLYDPIRNEMKIDIRMNFQRARRVQLKTMFDTPDMSNLQKCVRYHKLSCLVLTQIK